MQMDKQKVEALLMELPTIQTLYGLIKPYEMGHFPD